MATKSGGKNINENPAKMKKTGSSQRSSQPACRLRQRVVRYSYSYSRSPVGRPWYLVPGRVSSGTCGRGLPLYIVRLSKKTLPRASVRSQAVLAELGGSPQVSIY